jgi:hypothetical protein
MVNFVEIRGNKYPVGFSIRELFAICGRRNKSLEEIMTALATTGEMITPDAYELALELCKTGLNVGARREGVEARFTIEDLDDIFSEDLSVLEHMIDAIIKSINAPKVFPTPPKMVAKKKQRRER